MNRIALISFIIDSISIQILASYLKMNGYDTILIFCTGMFNERNSKELIELLKGKNISLIGISVFTDNYGRAVTATRLIKENIHLPVVWGGPHVNVRPEECLSHADMICIGEGEEALLELAESILKRKDQNTSIRNIWFKTNNTIIRNELRNLESNLDKYPFPDCDLDTQYIMTENGVVKWRDKFFQREEYDILTSRGCSFNCAYCYNNYQRMQYQGKGEYLRMRSIENVIQELVQAKKLFRNLKFIYFWDDNFIARDVAGIRQFKDLYATMIGSIPFYILSDPGLFNSEKIKLLRECGLQKIQVGIQSGSERLNREIYRRIVSNKKILEMAHYLHQLGIEVAYDLIFNNPYETRGDIIETINLLLKLPRPFSIQGYNLIFFPGTDITNRAICDGFISPQTNSDDFSTIEGYYDSPITTKGKDIFSTRFYSIHFDVRGKKYWNQIISMFEFRFIPEFTIYFLVKLFVKSDTFYKRCLLNGIIELYLFCRKIRNAFLRIFVNLSRTMRIFSRIQSDLTSL